MKANINELKLDFVEIQSHPEVYDIVIGVSKKCSQCNEVKLLSEFNKDKTRKDNYRSNCKICQKEWRKNNKEQLKEYQKEYYDNNKEQINENYKEYYKDNKEQIRKNQKEYEKNNKEQISKYKKEYQKINKEQILKQQNEYEKNRKKTDPLFKLTENIKSSVRQALKNKGFTKKSRTAEILGCSWKEFQAHLGKQMSRWMNWENQGKYNGELNFGWDLDHIIPLSSATNEEEVLKLCHYSNLQPLCSKINRDIKRDRTDFYDNQ